MQPRLCLRCFRQDGRNPALFPGDSKRTHTLKRGCSQDRYRPLSWFYFNMETAQLVHKPLKLWAGKKRNKCFQDCKGDSSCRLRRWRAGVRVTLLVCWSVDRTLNTHFSPWIYIKVSKFLNLCVTKHTRYITTSARHRKKLLCICTVLAIKSTFY